LEHRESADNERVTTVLDRFTERRLELPELQVAEFTGKIPGDGESGCTDLVEQSIGEGRGLGMTGVERPRQGEASG
jgi:hypothetical protein